MIDKKKIEEVARRCAEKLFSNSRYLYIEGFKQGVHWFKTDIWHDAKEEPSNTEKCHILLEWYENAAGRKDVKHYAIIDNGFVFWSSVLSTYSIVRRWCYLEDLV